MSSFTRYVIASALVLSSAGFFVCAKAQTKAPKKATVAGKVTIKGKPAPGIAVGLRLREPTSQFEPWFKARTDQEGNYRITDVPAGTYEIAPVAPAFVRSASQRTETVVLTEGESVEGIDFALVPGGVITGKVTDAENRPVVEQRVSLLIGDPPASQRGPIYPRSTVQTDDRGIYRIFGIAPGRYKVAMGEGDNNFYWTGRTSYKQTFYPDVSDDSKATVVEVTEGSEASNIDITVGRPEQMFAASGRVVDGENGQPIAGTRFVLQRMINEGDPSYRYVGVSAISNNKGEFRLENLTSGKYLLFLSPQQDSDLRSDAVTFEIVDQEMTGLIVKTSKGGTSLSGNIILENTDDKAVLATLMQLRVQAYVQKSQPAPNIGHSASINSDGSFQLNGLEAGTARILLGAQNRRLMNGFTVLRIERDGVVQPHGIEIKDGGQITGVRVVITYGNATIHGVVKLENGALPPGTRIFVQVSKDGEANSNSIRPPQVDTRGHFIIEGLPGGLYNLEANLMIPGGKPRPPVKQQVNVPDGGVTDVTITFDINPNPGASTP